MIKDAKKKLCLGCGFFCLGLGFVGLFLPVMPTAPFVIAAAWCFSRGSPRWHQWILRQPTIGPMIQEWEEHQVIRLRAKILATVAITISWSCSVYFFSLPKGLVIGVSLTIVCVLLYIWTRRSRPLT